MSLNFDRIKKVNPKTTNLIFGYFRECHKKYFNSDNPYYSIQPFLIYTCIAFYFKHEWNTEKMSDSIKINDDDVITKIADNDATVLMKESISSGVHEYEFKIIECQKAFGGWFDIVIGIINVDILSPAIGRSYGFHRGYFYVGTSNKLSMYYLDRQTTISVHEKSNCKTGSVIKLRANLESDVMELQYFVDDISVGIIKGMPNKTYVVGIYLYCEGTKIRLLR